jgi:hypothetical protein
MLAMFLVGVIIASAFINASGTDSANISDNIGRGMLIIFGSIYLLSVIGYFYISWLDYYMDIFILTNKRIIRLEQMVLYGQKVSETSFQHIQDVSSKVSGLLQTFFGVGTVHVETAGERANFSFTNMKNPGAIAAWILETQHEIWGRESPEDGGPHKTDLSIGKKDDDLKKMAAKNATIRQESLEDAIKDKLLIPKRIIDRLLKRDQQDPEDIPIIVHPKAVQTASQIMNEQKKEMPIRFSYRDGRKIIPEGVIWESEQYLTVDVWRVLNDMDNQED